ncbi:alpha/beta fold hydrolase [Janthinobacterium fluminis]|uniref:Alpha/beta hydrolase n=1 Tax=Janthinobacterium fluminis TaxID=2987524 RepID=A0ABT5JZ55_9BURK|nr:alpha/beta fold hydrolase [Janthinobacterium fluminis]MDC8757874.1 alpha/beta hydrolase [Janthinobacterium fluminis]
MHAHTALLPLACLLAACAAPAPDTRREHADSLAAAAGWQRLTLPADDFVLAAYGPAAAAGPTLTVYIEGDGLAWLSRARASDDPTPRRPLALELALRHGQGPAAYLARPCQYVDAEARRGCDVAYWTGRRFAPQVVAASSQAIDALKRRYGATQLVLVGYSGGGAVAALVAARRSDVARLVTVAGNLDHAAWTALHGVPPLAGSLNAADDWAALQHIPQWHFIGASDGNVGAGIAAAYAARFPAARRPHLQVVPGFDHSCCWAEQWPALSAPAFR